MPVTEPPPAGVAEPPPPPPTRGWTGPSDPAVAAVITLVPELLPRYVTAASACDDEPGRPVVLAELADLVAERLTTIEAERPVLERALAAVETLCASGGEMATLVGYAFFDSLSPEDRQRITPWLGSAARSLAEALDAGLV